MNLSNSEDDRVKDILEAIEELLSDKEKVIIAIDGRCASGKTTLARKIQMAYSHPSQILHMDDFYMPLNRRKTNWEQEIAGNMDFERFISQALLPAYQNKEIVYQPFSCQKKTLLESTLLEPCDLTIVEGSYAMHNSLCQYYDLMIFLTCNQEVQRNRIIEREKERYIQFEQRWIPMEEAYFKALNVAERCQLKYDTSNISNNEIRR